MSKIKTEREAWKFLARRWVRFLSNWKLNDRFRRLGLCFQIECLVVEGRVSENIATQMRQRIEMHRIATQNFEVYLWYITKAGARKRLAFCQQAAKDTA